MKLKNKRVSILYVGLLLSCLLFSCARDPQEMSCEVPHEAQEVTRQIDLLNKCLSNGLVKMGLNREILQRMHAVTNERIRLRVLLHYEKAVANFHVHHLPPNVDLINRPGLYRDLVEETIQGIWTVPSNRAQCARLVQLVSANLEVEAQKVAQCLAEPALRKAQDEWVRRNPFWNGFAAGPCDIFESLLLSLRGIRESLVRNFPPAL